MNYEIERLERRLDDLDAMPEEEPGRGMTRQELAETIRVAEERLRIVNDIDRLRAAALAAEN